MKNKFLLISKKKTISYDDKECFINGTAITKDGGSSKPHNEIAEDNKRIFYNEFFKKHFTNIVVLTAAGTSLDNGDSKANGKSREGLWEHCMTEIEKFETITEGLKEKSFYEKKNIEDLLSYLLLYKKIIVKKEDRDAYETSIAELETKIADACKLQLAPSAPHVSFLNKITARKPCDPRVKIFTTNYDTLFEQAANKAGFVVIDGFSFTHPRQFSGRYFDFDIVNREKTRLKHEDSFVKKVFHFHKLHGSLNWEKDNDKIIIKDSPKVPLIIYPANEKYESSYEQPYFEMMARFQQALRKDNVLLIVIGFGFQDKHIQNVIIEAVEQNPSFQLVLVNYNLNESIDIKLFNVFFDSTVSVEDLESNNKNNNEINESIRAAIKRNVVIIFDTFKEFTEKFPENQTYIESIETSDEAI